MIDRAKWQVPVLVMLAVFFTGRVAAQLMQYLIDVSFLPVFDDWQSGALPYGALLAGQIAILAVMAVVVRRARSGRLRLSGWIRRMLLAFGLLYFVLMTFRLLAGLTFLDGDGWFDALLPSIFHLVLASFVLTMALGSGAAKAPHQTAEVTT